LWCLFLHDSPKFNAKRGVFVSGKMRSEGRYPSFHSSRLFGFSPIFSVFVLLFPPFSACHQTKRLVWLAVVDTKEEGKLIAGQRHHDWSKGTGRESVYVARGPTGNGAHSDGSSASTAHRREEDVSARTNPTAAKDPDCHLW